MSKFLRDFLKHWKWFRTQCDTTVGLHWRLWSHNYRLCYLRQKESGRSSRTEQMNKSYHQKKFRTHLYNIYELWVLMSQAKLWNKSTILSSLKKEAVIFMQIILWKSNCLMKFYWPKLFSDGQCRKMSCYKSKFKVSNQVYIQ